jgi:hypothetical protein
MATGRIHAATAGGSTEAPYVALFWFFAGVLALGLLIYGVSRDRTD